MESWEDEGVPLFHLSWRMSSWEVKHDSFSWQAFSTMKLWIAKAQRRRRKQRQTERNVIFSSCKSCRVFYNIYGLLSTTLTRGNISILLYWYNLYPVKKLYSYFKRTWSNRLIPFIAVNTNQELALDVIKLIWKKGNLK